MIELLEDHGCAISLRAHDLVIRVAMSGNKTLLRHFVNRATSNHDKFLLKLEFVTQHFDQEIFDEFQKTTKDFPKEDLTPWFDKNIQNSNFPLFEWRLAQNVPLSEYSLQNACLSGCLEMFDRVLALELASPEGSKRIGQPCLNFAVRSGNVAIVKRLLDAKANA
ncbi:MAG: hypothetical protein Q4D38_02765 [Planctomycetia bacterium]|nr:hypothetical protein [Planctomycetia bacterium]